MALFWKYYNLGDNDYPFIANFERKIRFIDKTITYQDIRRIHAISTIYATKIKFWISFYNFISDIKVISYSDPLLSKRIFKFLTSINKSLRYLSDLNDFKIFINKYRITISNEQILFLNDVAINIIKKQDEWIEDFKNHNSIPNNPDTIRFQELSQRFMNIFYITYNDVLSYNDFFEKIAKQTQKFDNNQLLKIIYPKIKNYMNSFIESRDAAMMAAIQTTNIHNRNAQIMIFADINFIDINDFNEEKFFLVLYRESIKSFNSSINVFYNAFILIYQIRYRMILRLKLIEYDKIKKYKIDFNWFYLISDIYNFYKMDEINVKNFESIRSRILQFDTTVIDFEIHIIQFYLLKYDSYINKRNNIDKLLNYLQSKQKSDIIIKYYFDEFLLSFEISINQISTYAIFKEIITRKSFITNEIKLHLLYKTLNTYKPIFKRFKMIEELNKCYRVKEYPCLTEYSLLTEFLEIYNIPDTCEYEDAYKNVLNKDGYVDETLLYTIYLSLKNYKKYILYMSIKNNILYSSSKNKIIDFFKLSQHLDEYISFYNLDRYRIYSYQYYLNKIEKNNLVYNKIDERKIYLKLIQYFNKKYYFETREIAFSLLNKETQISKFEILIAIQNLFDAYDITEEKIKNKNKFNQEIIKKDDFYVIQKNENIYIKIINYFKIIKKRNMIKKLIWYIKENKNPSMIILYPIINNFINNYLSLASEIGSKISLNFQNKKMNEFILNGEISILNHEVNKFIKYLHRNHILKKFISIIEKSTLLIQSSRYLEEFIKLYNLMEENSLNYNKFITKVRKIDIIYYESKISKIYPDVNSYILRKKLRIDNIYKFIDVDSLKFSDSIMLVKFFNYYKIKSVDLINYHYFKQKITEIDGIIPDKNIEYLYQISLKYFNYFNRRKTLEKLSTITYTDKKSILYQIINKFIINYDIKNTDVINMVAFKKKIQSYYFIDSEFTIKKIYLQVKKYINSQIIDT